MPTATTIQPSSAVGIDTYVYSDLPNSNYSTADGVYVGNAGTYRILLQIPTTSFSSGYGLASGSLLLANLDASTSTLALAVQLQMTPSTWNCTSVTWNTKPSTVAATTTVSMSTSNNVWSTFGVPPSTILSGWLDGTVTNKGFYLMSTSTVAGCWRRVYAAESADGWRPKFIANLTNPPSVTAISPAGSVSAPTTFSDSVQPTLSASYTQSTDTADMTYRRDYIYDMAGNVAFDSSAAASTAVSGTTKSTSIVLGYLKYGKKYKWVCRFYDSYGGYGESTSYFICKLTATPAATDLAGGDHLYAMTTSGRIVALESGTVNIASTTPWTWDYSMPVKVKEIADWTDQHKTLEYVRVAYEMDTNASLAVSYSTRLVDLGDTADYRSVETLTGGSGIQVKKVHITSAGGDERVAHFHRVKLSGSGPCKIYSVLPVYRETVRNT